VACSRVYGHRFPEIVAMRRILAALAMAVFSTAALTSPLWAGL
jgi:hypothetical protein